jgi:predicted nucleotidyltransferase
MTAYLEIEDEQRQLLLKLIQDHLPDVKIWAYGSRTDGTARPSSDLDLVVFSRPDQESTVNSLREALEESNLTFRVDLMIWDEMPVAFQQRIKTRYHPLSED